MCVSVFPDLQVITLCPVLTLVEEVFVYFACFIFVARFVLPLGAEGCLLTYRSTIYYQNILCVHAFIYGIFLYFLLVVLQPSAE